VKSKIRPRLTLDWFQSQNEILLFLEVTIFTELKRFQFIKHLFLKQEEVVSKSENWVQELFRYANFGKMTLETTRNNLKDFQVK
jgi:hypothetical protein